MRARVVMLFAIVLTGLAPLASASASAPSRPAGRGPHAPAALGNILAQPGNAFVHVGNNANTEVDTTYLDDLGLNNKPATRFLTTMQLNAEGTVTARDNHPAQLIYSDTVGVWGIKNADSAALSHNTNWNIFVPPQDDTLITHVAVPTNTVGNHTTLDNLRLNGDPNAILFVTPVENPGAFAGADGPAGVNLPAGAGPFTQTVAVAYDTVQARWTIRTASGANLSTPAAFYVLKASADETAFTTISTDANRLRTDSAAIDNPLTNDNPDALILVTQNFGTGVTNQANNHWLGVYYEPGSGRWLIFNQDTAPMPTGVMFNVLVIPPKSGFFLMKAGNTNASSLRIDNPDLDSNPYARLYVMHNWNPPESNNLKFNDHPIGVFFNAAGDHHWYLYNRDFFPITNTATFNVYYTWPRANSFTISADAFNTTTVTGMTLNSPLLNDVGGARPIVSYNKYPNGSFGADYTAQVGLLFGVDLFWHIFSPGAPDFPLNLSYNVLAPPSSQSFVVAADTGPSGNASGNDLVIDNPLTNNDPLAFLFVTPRGAPGIDTNNIGVYYTGSRWGIFNEGFASLVGGQSFNVFVIKRHYVSLPLIQK